MNNYLWVIFVVGVLIATRITKKVLKTVITIVCIVGFFAWLMQRYSGLDIGGILGCVLVRWLH